MPTHKVTVDLSPCRGQNETRTTNNEKGRQMAQQKDRWDKAQILGTWAILLVIAFIGWRVDTSLKEGETRSRMIEMAVGILQEKPAPEVAALREWAVHVMERNSGVSGVNLTSEQLEKLRQYRLTGAFPCTLY